MITKIKRSLAVAISGPPKCGKSHLGAAICKQYGGIICNFSRVDQEFGTKKGEGCKYNIAVNDPVIQGDEEIVEVGEAYGAVEHVGLDLEYYKVINKWSQFEEAIEIAKFLSSEIFKKKIWIVIDDTVGLRWHKTMSISNKLGHKQIAQSDWKIAAVELKKLISELSKDFNLFLINQMTEEYKEYIGEDGKKIKEGSGKFVPNWIPKGADYLIDSMAEIVINRENIPWKQEIHLKGGWSYWQCANGFVPTYENITPDQLLDVLGIAKERR